MPRDFEIICAAAAVNGVTAFDDLNGVRVFGACEVGVGVELIDVGYLAAERDILLDEVIIDGVIKYAVAEVEDLPDSEERIVWVVETVKGVQIFGDLNGRIKRRCIDIQDIVCRDVQIVEVDGHGSNFAERGKVNRLQSGLLGEVAQEYITRRVGIGRDVLCRVVGKVELSGKAVGVSCDAQNGVLLIVVDALNEFGKAFLNECR